MARPLGHRLESHTKTFEIGGFCDFKLRPLPYREGLGLGGCLFSFFYLRQRKEQYGYPQVS